VIFRTQGGVEPYVEYVEALKDRRAAAKIKTRIMRAEMGNLGPHRSVGHGVIELKIDYGPGHRVYIGLSGNEWVILLCAGDKSTQEKDIAKAQDYWMNYRRTL